MITSSITLGSIVFGDVEFEGWSFKDLIDWWGQTEDKLDVVERPQAHGAFDVTRSLRTSRAISFTGTFIGSAQADVENAFDDLSAVGAEGPVEMVVSTPAGATMRTVTVESVTPVDHHGRRYGRYSVDLIARDPRRYDVNVQSASTTPAQPGQGRTWPAVWPLVWPGGGSSGRITLTNTGKAPSAPTFILEGGFDTALITCLETGARIGLNRQVPVGSEVVIDTKARRATIDGQSDVSRWLQYREWELIPPGASRTYQFDATGVVSTAVEVARNYALSPFGTAALPGYAGYPASTPAVESNVGGVALTNFPPPPSIPGHPSSALSVTIPAGAATGGGVSIATGLPEGNYVASMLVNRRSGATTQLQFAVRGWAGVGVARTFPFDQWIYLEEAFTVTSGQAPAILGWRTVNVVDPAPTNFFVANMQVAPVGQNVPQGALAVSGAGSGYGPGLVASFVGAPEASASVLSRTSITANLEGQVRSAWW